MYLDGEAAELAARQLHVIRREQLLALGYTRHQIRHGEASGRLRALYPGVLLTVGGRPTFDQRALAACYACGDGAFLSYEAAAHLWSLTATAPHRIDVTVSVRRNPRVRGISVHRSRFVGGSERTHKGPFPIARPGRALLDLAAITSRDDLELAQDGGLRRGLVSVASLDAYISQSERRSLPGTGRLRELISDRANGVPESVLETKTLALIRRYRLPEPVRQHRTNVNGRNVRFDFAYPDRFVAIEVDGRAPHSSLGRWQTDHERHNATELGPWTVLRFTWNHVTQQPLYVVVSIAQALGLVPARWR